MYIYYTYYIILHAVKQSKTYIQKSSERRLWLACLRLIRAVFAAPNMFCLQTLWNMLYVPLVTNYAEYQSQSECKKIEIQTSKGLAAIDFLQYIYPTERLWCTTGLQMQGRGGVHRWWPRILSRRLVHEVDGLALSISHLVHIFMILQGWWSLDISEKQTEFGCSLSDACSSWLATGHSTSGLVDLVCSRCPNGQERKADCIFFCATAGGSDCHVDRIILNGLRNS